MAAVCRPFATRAGPRPVGENQGLYSAIKRNQSDHGKPSTVPFAILDRARSVEVLR